MFNSTELVNDIQRWARALGFDKVGIANTDLSEHGARLRSRLRAAHISAYASTDVRSANRRSNYVGCREVNNGTPSLSQP